MKEAFCKWHNKPLKEVEEHKQEQCSEAGMNCATCEFMDEKEGANNE